MRQRRSSAGKEQSRDMSSKLEPLTDGPDGKLRERTVAYRPFPALKIFREKQRAAVGDSVPADSWDYV